MTGSGEGLRTSLGAHQRQRTGNTKLAALMPGAAAAARALGLLRRAPLAALPAQLAASDARASRQPEGNLVASDRANRAAGVTEHSSTSKRDNPEGDAQVLTEA
jgi:hypothetical protein